MKFLSQCRKMQTNWDLPIEGSTITSEDVARAFMLACSKVSATEWDTIGVELSKHLIQVRKVDRTIVIKGLRTPILEMSKAADNLEAAVKVHVQGSSRPQGRADCPHKEIEYNDDTMGGCGSTWEKMCSTCGKVWN